MNFRLEQDEAVPMLMGAIAAMHFVAAHARLEGGPRDQLADAAELASEALEALL